MKKRELYLKIFLNLAIFVVGTLFLIFLFPKILRLFAPFVIAWIIAMIANPLVRFMEKRIKIVRKHSSAIIIILVILAVIGAIYGVLYFIISQVSSLMNDIPSIISSVEELFNNASERFVHFYDVLPSSIQEILDGVKDGVQETLKSILSKTDASSIGVTASAVVGNIVDFALKAIITILSAYFFIKERDNLVEGTKKVLPNGIIQKYNIIMENFKIAFGGYVKAQLKITIIMVAILFIGFEFMRVKYSFLFAILIAFLDFLPFLGTGLVLWPWAVIELFASNIPRAICIMVVYLICQVVRQVIQPKMVGDSIGISPLTTLVFMFVGYQLYGPLGMILGIPVGLVLVKLYQIGMFDNIIKGFKLLIHDINEFRKF